MAQPTGNSLRQSAAPTIACINKASVPLGVDFAHLVAALQKYVDKHLAPVWGTGARLVKARAPKKNAWSLLLLDTAKDVTLIPLKGIDRKRIIGQHRREHHGLPLAMVFVKATLDAKPKLPDADKISVAASHELAEMLVDPGNNLWCEISKGVSYGYEVCDAVEDRQFRVNGLLMSNFVYPAYFEAFRKPRSARFDHMGELDRPLQILRDGYMPMRKNGELVLKPGSKAKRRQLKSEDRELHRSELRARADAISIKIGR